MLWPTMETCGSGADGASPPAGTADFSPICARRQAKTLFRVNCQLEELKFKSQNKSSKQKRMRLDLLPQEVDLFLSFDILHAPALLQLPTMDQQEMFSNLKLYFKV